MAPITPAYVNNYCGDFQLCINCEVIYSTAPQRGPLAMAIYAIATVPLVDHLVESTFVEQVRFLDDATAGRSLHHVKDWTQHCVLCKCHYFLAYCERGTL